MVQGLIAQFDGFDNLVLLTADRKLNEGGLTKLLRYQVAPCLKAKHRERFSLTLLYKKRKTSIDTYCAALIAALTESDVSKPGYSEKGL